MRDELLIGYLLGEINDEDTIMVNKWIAADPAHKTRYEQFKQVWETSKKLQQQTPTKAQTSLTNFKRNAGAVKPLAKVNSVRYLWLKAAAMLAVVITGALLLYKLTNQTAEPGTLVSLKTQKEVKIDTLADGSIITLNKNSAYSYPQTFTGHIRKVTLNKGEAFFDIAHDKAKPFIISINNVEVKVVGTSFNIKTRNNSTEIIVETGIVEVSRSGKVIRLHKGEKTVVTDGESPLAKANISDRLYQYYRTKQFIADDTPLWRVVEVLNEAYGSHIVIGDKKLRNLPLNTTFDEGSLDNNLEVISKTFGLSVVKNGDKITLK